MSHGMAGASDGPAGQMVSARDGNGGFSRSVWAYDDFTGAGEPPTGDLAADLTEGPTRRRSIRNSLRRRAWFCCATAMAGLIIGVGLFVKHPPGHQASTSILLAYGSNQNVAEASVNDLALAKSSSVAEATLQQLGLRQTLAGFLGSYTVTAVSDRVLQITVTAPSSAEAVRRANALASEVLQFRAALVQNQQRLVSAALNRQLAQATQQVQSITLQLNSASASPAASAQHDRIAGLEAELSQAQDKQSRLAAAITNYEANAQPATTAMVDGSKVLNAAAPIRRSLRHTITDPGGGLLAGLALGMSIVIVGAVASGRPRRRDDVARALGAPVQFSVGKVRLSRWLPGWLGLMAIHGGQIRRIAAYLGGAVPTRSRGVAALAVVPVDDRQVAARSLVSLAVGCAQQGVKVVLADLCHRAPAARLLGTRGPGVHEISVHDVTLVLVVPDPDDPVPIGPLGPGPHRSGVDPAGDPLAAACASADLLLTLADLDPALGPEHLSGWATDVVVMVTAGRSPSAKIHAVGDMIRLTDLSLVSGVLIGADKTDESLGVIPEPDADEDPGI